MDFTSLSPNFRHQGINNKRILDPKYRTRTLTNLVCYFWWH
ncbi:unnamed protein product [Spirodela intermedia]|uniref:Uncharacterized protein n=1 Tax=Spirodela intermedia TaxID=51605 RepID=A0A7I8JZ79_SPIIN|nr:unnamed protein product [Spirodela intermedia]